VPPEAREKLQFVLLDRVDDAVRTAIGDPDQLRAREAA
jgi:hypothetical protein